MSNKNQTDHIAKNESYFIAKYEKKEKLKKIRIDIMINYILFVFFLICSYFIGILCGYGMVFYYIFNEVTDPLLIFGGCAIGGIIGFICASCATAFPFLKKLEERGKEYNKLGGY